MSLKNERTPGRDITAAIILSAVSFSFSPSAADATAPVPERGSVVPLTDDVFSQAVRRAAGGIDSASAGSQRYRAAADKAAIEQARSDIAAISERIKERVPQSMKSMERTLTNYWRNMAALGYEINTKDDLASAWVLVAGGIDLCQHFEHDSTHFIERLAKELKAAGGDHKKFVSNVFTDSKMKRVSLQDRRAAADYFVMSSEKMPAKKREQLIKDALQTLIQDIFESKTKTQRELLGEIRGASIRGILSATVAKNEQLDTPEKRHTVVSSLRDRISMVSPTDTESMGKLRREVEATVTAIQYNALIDTVEEMNRAGVSGSLQAARTEAEQIAVAELFISAGALAVKQCGGNELEYQLMLPYAIGFDDEQVKACYAEMFGTETPSLEMPTITANKVASSIFKIGSEILKAKSPGDLSPKKIATEFIVREIVEGALSASSTIAKRVIDFINIPDDLGGLGLTSIKNFWDFYRRSSFLFPGLVRHQFGKMREKNDQAALELAKENSMLGATLEFIANRQRAAEAYEDLGFFKHNIVLQMMRDVERDWSAEGKNARFSTRINSVQTNLKPITKDAQVTIRQWFGPSAARHPGGGGFHIPNSPEPAEPGYRTWQGPAR